MNRTRNDQAIITLMSLICVGVTAESIIMGWEFWVPPLMILGIILIWVMHLTGEANAAIKEVSVFIYAMFALFFYGIHESSFFDTIALYSMITISFIFMNHIYMMKLFIVEYYIIMAVQIAMSLEDGSLPSDTLSISRIMLHVLAAAGIFFCCQRVVQSRIDAEELDKKKDEKIKLNDHDIEDFLSNISHELRTPVNVVNGLSDILLKKTQSREASAIKQAGIRLAGQIEDIQDYTESQRKDLFLEEEDYMCTSLINDIVTSFRINSNAKNLEMIVDLSPDVPNMMRGDIKKIHKIFKHLLSNAIKFTKQGGVFVRMYSEVREYGVNLCIEVTDTGIGMDRNGIALASKGMYQANKKRNRSSGGIGIGLPIVYSFTHCMGGFVKITSEVGSGTTVKVTLPQKVVKNEPCLSLKDSFEGDILFHVKIDKYKNPKVRDFYSRMATNLASSLDVELYYAGTVKDVERMIEKINVAYIFMGEEEYRASSDYFDRLSMGDIVVVVSSFFGFRPNPNSRVISMPKPLYAYPAVKILNEGLAAAGDGLAESSEKPDYTGIKALVVDDEPMNLVVAVGIFSEYGIITDTAGSGKEAIQKYSANDYDIVFMDHMMPEMDGVEAMKRIKERAEGSKETQTAVVALTANVLSGAKEMFIKEGFDGFIGKPINLKEFERVMNRLLPKIKRDKGGESVWE